MKKFTMVITDNETGEQDVIKTNNLVFTFENHEEAEETREEGTMNVGVGIKATNEFVHNVGSQRVMEKACAQSLAEQLPGELGELLQRLANKLR